MRGGHNASIKAAAAGGEAPPYRRLPRELRPVGKTVADAITRAGTYTPQDWPYFVLACATYAAALEPGDMPPTARARVLQAAGSMLAAFGLSPMSRDRVKRVEDGRSVGRRILDEIAEEGDA
jgi:hypothetical protein